jgi:hypothetical protein
MASGPSLNQPLARLAHLPFLAPSALARAVAIARARHRDLTEPDGHPDIVMGGIAFGGGLSMNEHRTALVLFAVALGVVVAVASVTTLAHVNTRKVSNDATAGTTGLARPHPATR